MQKAKTVWQRHNSLQVLSASVMVTAQLDKCEQVSNRGVTVEYYTLGMAAKAAGVSKTTISKAIANGKISVVEKHKDGFKIDPSELHRVFPMMTETKGQKVTFNNTSEQGVTASLETEIRLLREMLKREQEQNQFLQEQIARSTLLIEASRQQEPQNRKGFIASFFGK